MKLPKTIEKLSQSFERLPGIGPKTAQRLAFYLLHVPQSNLEDFSNQLLTLKENTKICSICYNIGDTEICSVCSDPRREISLVCVVEDALDVVALEKSGKYRGLYHVLHGVIDPLNAIGPDDIYIPQLMKRIMNNKSGIREIILATNPTMEGEATAMYIQRNLKTQPRLDRGQNSQPEADGFLAQNLKITRIGHGLPVGADIEYADETTLERALEGRREY